MKVLLFALLVTLPVQSFATVALYCQVLPSNPPNSWQYFTGFHLRIDKDPITGEYLVTDPASHCADDDERCANSSVMKNGVITLHRDFWSYRDHYIADVTIENNKGTLSLYQSIDCLGENESKFHVLCEAE